MKAIISLSQAIGVVGVTYMVVFFTINLIKVLRECRNTIDVEKKKELKLTLVILIGMDGIYVVADIVLLRFFWDALKSLL